jgi:hypothetical protein
LESIDELLRVYKVIKPPAGTVADPMGALDRLFATRQIDNQAYHAGLFYVAAHRSQDQRAGAIVKSCDEALDHYEIDLGPILRVVGLLHRPPLTVNGMERLRFALRLLAAHLAVLEAEIYPSLTPEEDNVVALAAPL